MITRLSASEHQIRFKDWRFDQAGNTIPIAVVANFRWLVAIPQKTNLFVAVALADTATKAVIAIFPAFTVRGLQLSELVAAVPAVVPGLPPETGLHPLSADLVVITDSNWPVTPGSNPFA